MISIIKKLVIWKLNILARIYLYWYKPIIIAITGNVGKTSTKEAITTVLSSIKRVRSGKGNLNNEFGVPLTIIGDWSDDYYETGNSAFFWLKVIAVSTWRLIKGVSLIKRVRYLFSKKRYLTLYPELTSYPEILVLEYGADKPGDIYKLCNKFKPHISVVTAIGEIPVHVEFFQTPAALAKEKSELTKCLNGNDYVVLNYDDQVVLDMKENTKARMMSFGFGEQATVKILNFDFRSDNAGRPIGVSFKLHYGSANNFVPVKIDGSLGKSQAYAAAAASAVGVIFKMNLVDISEALSDYRGPKGRLKILKGIKNSTIIDDTYNASPSSTHLALETLQQARPVRRVAILGDMLELGEYTELAHRAIGDFAGSFADMLICVGLRSKFIADSAANQMSKDNIFHFDTAIEALSKIDPLIKEGDLVLVKGSQGIRMEKIVEEIMAEPESKKELLVRQGKKWV